MQGEHGTGRNVAPFVEMEWGSKAYDLMWELKGLFDPDYVLNPGVVLNRVRTRSLSNTLADSCGLLYSLVQACGGRGLMLWFCKAPTSCSSVFQTLLSSVAGLPSLACRTLTCT